MKTINHICAIFIKQIKDSLKNRLVLVVFFMFPILALVFKEIVSEVELDFILPSFMTMNTVMVPIIFMSSIVSEEKEKKTLRMLIMSNVKAWEYLIGVGFCVFLLALISNCVFLFIILLFDREIVTFIVSSIIGIILSLLIGSILAILSKNQMSVGPITAPVSMIIGLLPMFSAMNSELEKIAKDIYSYYVRQMFVTRELENSVNSWLILLINFLVLSLVFAIFYRIKGLNNE